MTKEEAAEQWYDKTYKSRDIEDGHFFDSINEAFLAGYDCRDQSGWIDCKTRLPDMPNDYSGNKASNPVLVWNGEDIYKAYCEAIRPDFVTIIWDLSDVMDGKNDSHDPIKEYSGKSVTHWMPLPKSPKI